ncbi:hypothetical protein CHH28_04235 [Bacterioplanes sanyensis]|uniref:Uncharacterized protein n=1 Tax=Bacterioplanes sanyensis TaxID=1249553 RepID=A0A222FI89_9GAMM|nr:hypothetical protein [Bacterioplanes sanyensis]ASP37933.1 hypothetical protein CHH28_04235 [Bacterioplanes sanyensis]
MNESSFLNIDLDLESEHDLRPLAQAWGDDVCVFRLDNDDGVWRGSFETMEEDAEQIIDKYHQLVTKLSPPLRALWDSAHQRVFDIGFQSGAEPRLYRSVLSAQAISKIEEMGGSIAVSIYANNDN